MIQEFDMEANLIKINKKNNHKYFSWHPLEGLNPYFE